MADDIRLRPAERKDTAELAILLEIASHGLSSWNWYIGVLRDETDTAFEYGLLQMLDESKPGGWKESIVAEKDGEIAGLSIGWPLGQSILEEEPAHAVYEPLLALQKQVVGNWFIDSLGVYRRFRGLGIGRRLLENEIARGGGRPVSLITESYNERAQALYKGTGFREVARREAVPFHENGTRHEWVLFTREVG
ncbi:N-acetyltransferase [Mesorhizobium sp. RMAD-H1]|uniref:GNAT family N-acetyltransferase n=1 Tax=Mesorhizobium sp. RMAD-H1 TaxID=2587065 RepID=UPI001618A5D2|nr:N-acetyltransferase [Mesorhizobium sp. RMAD-H1]MBB2970672.1 ribosomal protein S18 acetylase RimI-like enzyme [Mesorhizobium sp. RMAD-H1]